jgi:hypothetical protein
LVDCLPNFLVTLKELRIVATSDSYPPEPKGFSGKSFTAGVLILLLALFIGIAYFLTVVHRLDRTRLETAEYWRQVAVLLDRDYRKLEQVDDLPDAEDLPDQWPERFSQLADQFRTAIDPLQQRSLSEQAEQAIAEVSLAEWGALSAASPELRQRVQAYNQSLSNERDILDSVGGRLVTTFLVIPRQSDFPLSR